MGAELRVPNDSTAFLCALRATSGRQPSTPRWIDPLEAGHAGVAAEAHESQRLERLCRYIARPALSEKRLSLSPQGRVRYELKTPWRNGTTHVEWDAEDFIAKLAALVPPPRAHLTRFHGVFAPNAALRTQLTPSGRGKRPATDAALVEVSASAKPRSTEEKRRAMQGRNASSACSVST